MYWPSGENARKLSSCVAAMPRPGAAGRVVRTRLPAALTRCHASRSRYVSALPSGLKAYWPESKPVP